MSAAASGWADLPWEILLLITRRLQMADVIRVRAVCYQWAWGLGKSCGRLHPTTLVASPENPFSFQYSSSPWLLLPMASGEVAADSCSFLSLSEDRRYRISSLPQITGRRLVGSSSDGWVVTVDPLFTPRLLNPLTRQEISLPSLSTLHKKLVPINSGDDGSQLSAVFYTGFGTTFPIETVTETFCDRYLTKIILTCSPLEGGFAVAVCTFPNQESFLASAAPGDEAWTPVYEFDLPEQGLDGQSLETFEDVVYHRDEEMLYALTHWPAVMIFKRSSSSSDNNIGSWDLHSMVATAVTTIEKGYWRRYIVFSGGELLQIIRHMKEDEEADHQGDTSSSGINYYCQLISNGFKISKFDQELHDRHKNTEPDQLPLCIGDSSCWVSVDSLGDQSLFLGYNNSFSMTCGDDDVEFGPHRNRIYFADDKDLRKSAGRTTLCDAGVYHMDSKAIESLLCPSDYRHSLWFMPTQPLWPDN